MERRKEKEEEGGRVRERERVEEGEQGKKEDEQGPERARGKHLPATSCVCSDPLRTLDPHPES